ncbi:MAG: hypothetical protein GXO48_03265, partial [Chlorobi bacterium]|nr:hypothetical protein [Chlorobiota bacterium]
MHDGFIFRTGGGRGVVAIDSLGRMGIRTLPNADAWQHINGRPSLYVNHRIVARHVLNYPSDGSELPYLPYHVPCNILLHDTTVDIGDTAGFWLQRCKFVTLILDSGKVYRWNKRVALREFQKFTVYCPATFRPPHPHPGSDSTRYDCIIKMDSTPGYCDVLPSCVGKREPGRVKVVRGALFRINGVKIYETANDTAPLTPRSYWAGLFSIYQGGEIVISHSVIHATENIVNVGGWGTHAVVQLKRAYFLSKTNLRNIYVVSTYSGWNITGHGGFVHRTLPEIRVGPGVLWDTTGRLIYFD